MKKSTKFFFNLFILIAAGLAVFFVGWVQFYVKPGNCGIMKSKTGGIYESPLISGKFLWRWERLLPTNVTIDTYSLEPYSSSSSYSGTLPSSEIYSKLTEPAADFSYDIRFRATVTISPEGILRLVKENKVNSQEELDAYLKTRIDLLTSGLAKSLIAQELPYVPSKDYSEDEIKTVTARYSSDLKDITFTELALVSAKIPDIQVYNRAKQAYNEYEQALTDEMKRHAEEQAASLLEEDRTMVQLEKFAQLLKDYPELAEFSKSGDITQIISTLRNLR